MVMLMSEMAYRNALKIVDEITLYVKDADVKLEDYYKKFVKGQTARPKSRLSRSPSPEPRQEPVRMSPNRRAPSRFSQQEEEHIVPYEGMKEKVQ